MKLIDGGKLERHLDYLIKKDNQFAKMCDGEDDYSRQRKYCFEVNALAYQLCKNVMDYYLVKDVQLMKRGEWVSDEYGVHCSHCNKTPPTEEVQCGCQTVEDYILSDFCPHCGARMDLKDGDAE